MKVKICGITRVEDLHAVERVGADYVGLICYSRSPRYVTQTQLSQLANVRIHAKRVGVFVDADFDSVTKAVEVGALDVVQLHGRPDVAFAQKLMDAGYEVWQAVHVSSAVDVARYVDFPAHKLLVDAARGGSGLCCDWQLAEQLASRRDVLLAGGLTPQNVAAAIAYVRPWGIDVSTGVEFAPGIKDFSKLTELYKGINQ